MFTVGVKGLIVINDASVKKTCLRRREATLDRTSKNVDYCRDECPDVMLVATEDAEGQCGHHDNQASDDDWR